MLTRIFFHFFTISDIFNYQWVVGWLLAHLKRSWWAIEIAVSVWGVWYFINNCFNEIPETTVPISIEFYRNDPRMVFYQDFLHMMPNGSKLVLPWGHLFYKDYTGKVFIKTSLPKAHFVYNIVCLFSTKIDQILLLFQIDPILVYEVVSSIGYSGEQYRAIIALLFEE